MILSRRFTWVSAILANCLISALGSAQTITTYQHIVIDPNPSVNGSDTLVKVLVDINGDGNLDAVLGEGSYTGGPGGLYWYEAPPSGKLADPWIKHTIAASGDFYEDIVAFDVNGDGAPDLIASDSNQVVWFENPRGHGGDPRNPWTKHVIRSGGTSFIQLADIDGDGKMDVVVSGSSILGAPGAVLFQNSPTSWAEVRFGGGTARESVPLLDIGSGKGAINIATGDGDNVVWYENPRESGGNARSGTWARHIVAPFPLANEDSLASGVFSSSGRMDLIFAPNEDFSHTGLYRMIAPADRRTPWTVQTIDSTYQSVHKINVGDMNKDGKLDFVVAEQEQAHNSPPGYNQNFNKQRVAVFYNDGNGNFIQQVIATTGSQNQTLGDIDGDGDLDILGANHGVYGAPRPLETWVNQLSGGGGGNLVQNPGFETSSSLAPWKADGSPSAAGIDNTPSHAHSGNQCGFIWDASGRGKFVDLSQVIQVAPNAKYTLTAGVDANNTIGGNIGVRTLGGTNIATAAFVNIDPGPSTHAADYRQYTVAFSSGSNTSVVVFVAYTTPGTSSFINVDDVSLLASP
jgi:hypothetical protein